MFSWCIFNTFVVVVADIKHNARRTEPIDELFMNIIYGIQFSGLSAQNILCQHLLNFFFLNKINKCCCPSSVLKWLNSSQKPKPKASKNFFFLNTHTKKIYI